MTDESQVTAGQHVIEIVASLEHYSEIDSQSLTFNLNIVNPCADPSKVQFIS